MDKPLPVIAYMMLGILSLSLQQGFFCPEGTSAPEPCPEGMYSSRLALSDGSECSPCGGGQYCSDVGLSEASGSCQERFYCRQGAKSAVCKWFCIVKVFIVITFDSWDMFHKVLLLQLSISKWCNKCFLDGGANTLMWRVMELLCDKCYIL